MEKTLRLNILEIIDRPDMRILLPSLKASCRDCDLGSDSSCLPADCTQIVWHEIKLNGCVLCSEASLCDYFLGRNR